jgi:hypothetical protein
VSGVLSATTKARLNIRGTFMGWGASAKAAVFLNSFAQRVDRPWMPEAIIDETPSKQGFLMPGVHTPIIPCPASMADVDVLWILSWNWAAELKRKAKALGFKGKYLMTSPTVRFEE